jgi:hypothetical protein
MKKETYQLQVWRCNILWQSKYIKTAQYAMLVATTGALVMINLRLYYTYQINWL